MAGVVFIVNVPKKAYELVLKNNNNSLQIEKEKFDKTSKLINELKEKQSGIPIKNRTDDGSVNTQSTDSTNSVQFKSNLYLHKTKSDICLAEGYLDEKSYGTIWGDIKQLIKQRKNKLIINKPVRGIHILGAFHWDTPLETILSEVVSRLDIRNVVWNSTNDDKFWQVIFSMESGNSSEDFLQVLRTFGIGSKHQSSVSVVPCALYYKANDQSRPTSIIKDQKITYGNGINSWSRFSSTVRARSNLAQVLQDVRASAALTFDWLFLLLVAAFVAAIGLIEESTVILVASMLISPLMNPVTAGTLGTAVRDRSLQRMGILNEFLGLFLCLVIGFIFGLTISVLDERYGVVGEWPTREMVSRCEYRSLWVGVLVALPTGAAVALAVLSDYTSSLVGVAISASLLPPAVNAGLLWAMAFVHFVSPNAAHTPLSGPENLAILGTVSLCLTLINIACIFLSGVVVYKVKKVCPLERRDISWWRENGSRVQEGTDNNSRSSNSSLNWNIYNKWCSETLERKQETEKTNAAPVQVQSDTVTFRRPSAMSRLSVQSIENYCLTKAQSTENYVSLESRTEINESSGSKNATLTSEDNVSISSDATQDIDTFAITVDNSLNKLCSYRNLGYSNDEESEIQQPTIEPSLSYTMAPKKPRVIFASKIIDV